MAYKMRPATFSDLLSIAANRRRQRVLRLNPPYTLVMPDAMMADLLRSRIPMTPRVISVCVFADGGGVLGYVQARCRWRRRDEWTITTLSASDKAPERVWEALLEGVCEAAGEEGV